MKKYKIKKIKLNLKIPQDKRILQNVLKQTLFILSSIGFSFLLATLLIGAPHTELLLGKVGLDNRYDLSIAQYYTKEYEIKVEFTPSIRNIYEEIRLKRDLQKRLEGFLIKNISISTLKSTTKDNKKTDTIQLIVTTNMPESTLDQLITTSGYYIFMKPKPNLENDKDKEFKQMFPSNYDKTEFDSNKMRSFTIRKLPSNLGKDAYFGMLKPKFKYKKTYEQFLRENADKKLGLKMGAYVRQVTIPPINNQTGRQDPVMLGLSFNKDDALIYKKIYGKYPSYFDYTVEKNKKLNFIPKDQIQYEQLVLAIVAAILTITLYNYLQKKDIEMYKTVVYIFTLSSWISYLKIFAKPTDLSNLLIESILLFLIIEAIFVKQRLKERIWLNTILLFLFITTIFTGNTHNISADMLPILLIVYITQAILKNTNSHLKWFKD